MGARYGKAKGPYVGTSGGGGTPGENVPGWITPITVQHTAFQTAGLTQDISLYTLPAGGLIHGVKLKQSVAFAGTGITSYSLSIGFVGALDDLLIDYPVDAAPADDLFAIAATFDSRNHAATVDVRIRATAVGANLDQSTAGTAQIWLLVSRPV